jgi:fermentation-respiration switch protein FrsA (DUF1100 family)
MAGAAERFRHVASASLYLAIALAAIYLVALFTLFVAQRKLLYFPSAVAIPPAALGFDARVVHLTTADGETLLAWYVAPAAGKPLILYFHGNGGALDLLAERFKRLVATGNGLLAIEYRGYAGSTGSPSEQGLLADGEAAYDWAIASGAAPVRIVLLGESLGSGVAVALAAKRRVGAVALDSPYTSIADVAAAIFWMFPVRVLIRDSYRSDQWIANVAAPLLIVHGSADNVVPIRFGERLFALANSPKQFIRVDGAGHLALGERIPEVLAWIERSVR